MPRQSPPKRPPQLSKLLSLDNKTLSKCLGHLTKTDLVILGATCIRLFYLVQESAYTTAKLFRRIQLSARIPLNKENQIIPERNYMTKLSIECICNFMDHLRSRSLLNLASVNKFCRTAVIDLFRRKTFRALDGFDLNPSWFLPMMATTKTVIGGSVAFLILTNNDNIGANIDLFTPASQEETVLAIILDKSPFLLLETTRGRSQRGSVKANHSLQHEKKTINIRIATTENAVLPIFFSPSSIQMNFVAANGIYCAYPRLTLHLKAILNFARFTNHNQLINFVSKYRSRGIGHIINRTSKNIAHSCTRSSTCPSTARCLLDSMGLVIKFPYYAGQTYEVNRHNTVYDDKHTVVWNMGQCTSQSHRVHTNCFAISQTIGLARLSSTTLSSFFEPNKQYRYEPTFPRLQK
ncbi:hypothetical protein B0H10DRAFT_2349860 [Mycena sp. CBHHK59/15]|nr:hypothetical protein B0H10DRAFT_2349860 [Mycena sp. CBHHK59/15]